MKLGLLLLTCTIAGALEKITPNAVWVVRGNDIEWLDKNQEQPSNKEIEMQMNACLDGEIIKTSEQVQALTDAKDQTKTDTLRIDALIKALGY